MMQLSTVSEQTPNIQKKGVEVMLLNIHESPGKDMLEKLGFEMSPTYLVFDKAGEEVFRSNMLPAIDKIVDAAQS